LGELIGALQHRSTNGRAAPAFRCLICYFYAKEPPIDICLDNWHKDHRPTLFTKTVEIELQKCKHLAIDNNFQRCEAKSIEDNFNDLSTD